MAVLLSQQTASFSLLFKLGTTRFSSFIWAIVSFCVASVSSIQHRISWDLRLAQLNASFQPTLWKHESHTNLPNVCGGLNWQQNYRYVYSYNRAFETQTELASTHNLCVGSKWLVHSVCFDSIQFVGYCATFQQRLSQFRKQSNRTEWFQIRCWLNQTGGADSLCSTCQLKRHKNKSQTDKWREFEESE